MTFKSQIQVEKTGENTWKGLSPLGKPSPKARGVFGGWIIAQSLLVGIRSCPQGFTPHSLQSYFLKAGDDAEVFNYEVDQASNGRNFCNRIVRAFQGGQLKYIANISLTRKNSVKEATKAYEAQEQRKRENGDEETKPFGFGRPYPEWLKKYNPEDLPTNEDLNKRPILHKLPPEMYELEMTQEEEQKPVSERQLSFFVRCLDDSFGEEQEQLEMNACAAAYLTDSLFLTRLARILRIPSVDHYTLRHYFSISLDHIMYFHDTDYDPTKWMGFSYNAMSMSNSRVLLEGEMYNAQGKHVISVIQEGLVMFGDLENQAKL